MLLFSFFAESEGFLSHDNDFTGKVLYSACSHPCVSSLEQGQESEGFKTLVLCGIEMIMV